jgi:hypothetical protein
MLLFTKRNLYNKKCINIISMNRIRWVLLYFYLNIEKIESHSAGLIHLVSYHHFDFTKGVIILALLTTLNNDILYLLYKINIIKIMKPSVDRIQTGNVIIVITPFLLFLIVRIKVIFLLVLAFCFDVTINVQDIHLSCVN